MHVVTRLANVTTKPLFENANYKFYHEQIPKAAKGNPLGNNTKVGDFAATSENFSPFLSYQISNFSYQLKIRHFLAVKFLTNSQLSVCPHPDSQNRGSIAINTICPERTAFDKINFKPS